MIKEGRLTYLLDLNLTKGQQKAIMSIFNKENEMIKHFVNPHFEAKDPKKVLQKKYKISKELFEHGDPELAQQLDNIREFQDYIESRPFDYTTNLTEKVSLPYSNLIL